MIFTKEKLSFLKDIEKQIDKELYNVTNYTKIISNLIKNNLLNKEGFLKVYLEGGAFLGKSTIVKKYAENIPGATFLRIDLKEYKSSYDINKLLGTTQGYVGYNDEHLFSRLKNNNFTIILFDNYKEAHQSIKDLIKDILKEKVITDNRGEKIYFNNTFIFITDDIVNNKKIGFNNKNEIEEYNELYDLVDEVIKFNNLDLDTLTNYLKSKKVKNIDKIIKNSNYEKYNYKNIEKLIKEDSLIKN